MQYRYEFCVPQTLFGPFLGFFAFLAVGPIASRSCAIVHYHSRISKIFSTLFCTCCFNHLEGNSMLQIINSAIYLKQFYENHLNETQTNAEYNYFHRTVHEHFHCTRKNYTQIKTQLSQLNITIYENMSFLCKRLLGQGIDSNTFGNTTCTTFHVKRLWEEGPQWS